MAASGISRQIAGRPWGALGPWLTAVFAATLSLAAALVAVSSEGSASAPSVSPAGELAARNERIAFFEARARADVLDFPSLNVLAGEYLQRARDSGDIGDYQRAELAATRSLAVNPSDNFSGVLYLTVVRLTQHEFAAALDLARRAIELKPASAAAYGALGDALVGLGRYEEAGVAYQTMLARGADLASFSRLAHLAWLEGDLLNAEDFWKQALRLKTAAPLENRAWARVQLGSIYLSVGDIRRAEQQHRTALELYPDYAHALAGLAAVRAAQARWEASIALYVRAAERLPLPQYVAALGDVYARAGRTAEAEAQYQLVEAIDRLYRANGVNTDLQLALFYADHDRSLDQALFLAENAYSASPGVYAADALAWALYKAGRYAEADAKSREALRLGSPDASLLYHAGLIRLALDDRAGAASLLSQALRLNPHFSPLLAEKAKKTLAELRGGKP